MAVIRFFFRLFSVLALAVAVIMAVIDATRSVAANDIVLTPLGSSWYAVSPDTLNLAQAMVQRYLLPAIWDPVVVMILTLPGFAVFLALSLLFYLIGRRPSRRLGRLGHVGG